MLLFDFLKRFHMMSRVCFLKPKIQLDFEIPLMFPLKHTLVLNTEQNGAFVVVVAVDSDVSLKTLTKERDNLKSLLRNGRILALLDHRPCRSGLKSTAVEKQWLNLCCICVVCFLPCRTRMGVLQWKFLPSFYHQEKLGSKQK